MDFDLMPPPGSSKKAGTSMDVDQSMIDPNEPTYCICNQVSSEIIYVLVCPGSYISYLHEHFFLKYLLNNYYLSLVFQISYGDMIACDNENVSHFGTK